RRGVSGRLRLHQPVRACPLRQIPAGSRRVRLVRPGASAGTLRAVDVEPAGDPGTGSERAVPTRSGYGTIGSESREESTMSEKQSARSYAELAKRLGFDGRGAKVEGPVRGPLAGPGDETQLEKLHRLSAVME